MTAEAELLRRTGRPMGALRRDQRGATILEFGLIAPSLMLMLIGALDIGHTLYMQGVLQGTVQKAARDGTLESSAGASSAARDAIDAQVRNQLLTLNRSATVTFRRRFYRTFTAAAAQAAEQFTDTNGDGLCNNNEPFDDRNNNTVRDTDGADSVDHAGARDNVIYTVNISYPRLFPLDRMIGGSGTVSLTAATVLASQPYGDQGSYGAAGVGHCA
jgi:Flp pilus assembly protein TadG